MKATRRQPSSLAALALKWVGTILILSYLLDLLVEPLPYQFLNLGWRIVVERLLVDKGIIALMGLAILFAGDWIDANTTNAPAPQNKLLDMRFWALILSSVFGFVFFILAPLHIIDVNRASTQQLEQIEQQALQAENQIETRFGSTEFQQQVEQQLPQAEEQLREQLKNEEWFNQQLEQATTEEEKSLIQGLKDNPQSIDEYLRQQVQALPDRQLTQLRQEKEDREKQIRMKSWQSSLRIGLSSWLLSAGYIVIGWTGLRGMLSGSPRVSRQAPMS